MTKEDFNKLWKDSTKEEILNQYYYDYKELQRLNNIINKYDIFLKHELSFEGHSIEWIENKLQYLKGSDK